MISQRLWKTELKMDERIDYQTYFRKVNKMVWESEWTIDIILEVPR